MEINGIPLIFFCSIILISYFHVIFLRMQVQVAATLACHRANPTPNSIINLQCIQCPKARRLRQNTGWRCQNCHRKPTRHTAAQCFQGRIKLEADACFCTAIKCNILGIDIHIPFSLSLLVNICGKKTSLCFHLRMMSIKWIRSSSLTCLYLFLLFVWWVFV